MGLAFVSNKKDLLKLIKPALAGTAQKHTLPALEGLLFRLEWNTLTVCGYDMEKGIQTNWQVKATEQGAVVLNAKKLYAIISALPDGEIEIKVDEKNRAHIKAGTNDFTLNGITPDAFPSLPEFAGEQSFTIHNAFMRDLIESTSFAVAKVDTRPILTGVYFKVEKQGITAVALDNYRMAVRSFKRCVIENEETFDFVVPGKSLAELNRLLVGDDMVTVEVSAKYVIFKTTYVTLFSRKIEGDYLDYKRAIPKQNTIFATVETKQFAEAVKIVSLMTDEKRNKAVNCVFSDHVLTIQGNAADGSGKSVIAIDKDGEDLSIWFNNSYLLDALNACQDEKIKCSMSNGFCAMVIEPVAPYENGTYLYIVLPVKPKG